MNFAEDTSCFQASSCTCLAKKKYANVLIMYKHFGEYIVVVNCNTIGCLLCSVSCQVESELKIHVAKGLL